MNQNSALRSGAAARSHRGSVTSVPQRFQSVRRRSEDICAPLAVEDYTVQTMPDVSPPKWHLAHVTWFFEAFVLKPFAQGYREFHPQFHYLFNSYYYTAGSMHPRAQRGLLSRPTVEQVYAYRGHVDQHMVELLDRLDRHPQREEITARTTLGCHHEEQHQELLLTDIKHILGSNPLRPAYRSDLPVTKAARANVNWLEYDARMVEIGATDKGFCFDNELPRHRAYVPAFKLMNRRVTNGEFLEFIEADGYNRVELWLSDAWSSIKSNNWQAPLYWERVDSQWMHMTLGGMRPIDEHAPVCHVSFYEADAYARWQGMTLPTEQAWESVAAERAIEGNFFESGYLQPVGHEGTSKPIVVYGDVWEWTRSAYTPYPGFRPLSGTLGEYNGKFMCNQLVLRGGSCATPQDHIRSSYRNFFYPKDRWQFSGFRLMEEIA